MAHDHHHPTATYGRMFAIAVALNVGYVLLETGFGLAVGSLALLSDAGHNLSDVFGLLLAWGGHALANVKPTARRTYGYRGTSILAALLNGLLLLVAVGAISWEALQRFWQPTSLGGGTVIAVAWIGVVINTATALLFIAGSKHDLNLRGAFLHMAADAAVSLAVVLAGVAIYFTGWGWIDPATSLLVAMVIFISTWDLLKESVNLATQAVPRGIDPAAVAAYLRGLDGVSELHDMHIWAMSTTDNALTAHLVRPEVADDDELLDQISHYLEDHFGIAHATIQIERGRGPACHHADPDLV